MKVSMNKKGWFSKKYVVMVRISGVSFSEYRKNREKNMHSHENTLKSYTDFIFEDGQYGIMTPIFSSRWTSKHVFRDCNKALRFMSVLHAYNQKQIAEQLEADTAKFLTDSKKKLSQPS